MKHIIFKLLGSFVSFCVLFWLLRMTDTVPDKWFTTWLQGTIAAIAFAIFFTAWTAESIYKYLNSKN